MSDFPIMPVLTASACTDCAACVSDRWAESSFAA